jgi:hypothetical protein
MPRICGADLVVVARLRAAAVLRLDQGRPWKADMSVSVDIGDLRQRMGEAGHDCPKEGGREAPAANRRRETRYGVPEEEGFSAVVHADPVAREVFPINVSRR